MTRKAGDYMKKRNTTDKSQLVNIEDIVIDENKSQEERIKEFYRQIKNPYRFLCGDVIVNVIFTKNGKNLEDALKDFFKAEI